VRCTGLLRIFRPAAVVLVVGAIGSGCASTPSAPRSAARPPAQLVVIERGGAPLVASAVDERESEARERAYVDALARLRAERIAAVDRDAPPTPAVLAARAKGWGWLIDRLAADGIPRERAARAFADRRVPAFQGLTFGLQPREPYSMYRHFLRADSVARAQRCAAAHALGLADAERVHGVDAPVVAAILHVESACGRNTGRSLVLHRLARLAMANEPHNVARNLARNTPPTGRIDPAVAERVRERARYLEGIFYPQVVATFEIAAQNGIDPLAIRGSGAGAFGYTQFLPLNYIAFGTDGNGDGRVSLYDVDDAVASTARFLKSYGWKRRMPRSAQREVVWHYNRSDAYIDAVLGLADRIRAERTIEIAAAAARSAPDFLATAVAGEALEVVPAIDLGSRREVDATPN
jgi:membrane-bound lytic murein transglycosylase B